MQPNPAFSSSDWLEEHHICATCETKKGKLELFGVNRTSTLTHFCERYQWKLGKTHGFGVYFLLVQMFFSVCCMCVPVSLPLVASALFNRLWGRVAGSRSVSEFPETEEVTSGFLCGDGQVLWCYCEGHKTSSVDALLVNVWNLIRWARAPVGGNMPPSQSSHPASLSFPLFFLILRTLSATAFTPCEILCKENINFI